MRIHHASTRTATMVPSIWTSPMQTVMACGIISHDEKRCEYITFTSSKRQGSVVLAPGLCRFHTLGIAALGPVQSAEQCDGQRTLRHCGQGERVTTSPALLSWCSDSNSLPAITYGLRDYRQQCSSADLAHRSVSDVTRRSSAPRDTALPCDTQTAPIF